MSRHSSRLKSTVCQERTTGGDILFPNTPCNISTGLYTEYFPHNSSSSQSTNLNVCVCVCSLNTIGCQVAVGGISAANLTDDYITVVLRSASFFFFLEAALYLCRAFILIRCESIELYPPRVFCGTWSPPNRSQTSHTRTNIYEWSLQRDKRLLPSSPPPSL